MMSDFRAAFLHAPVNAFSRCLFALVVFHSPCLASAADKLITFNDNGAWCWFQAPRVVVDKTNNTMLIASVANAQGPDGANRSGDIDLTIYHLDSGKTDRFVLRHGLQPEDDHNTPALYIRTDGRYLAMYSRHNKDSFTYWRISRNPHDAAEWFPEQTYDWAPQLKAVDLADHVTYSNLFYLPAEDTLYDFTRSVNRDPSILISKDQGDMFNYGGKLLTVSKLGYVNGYVKYASNNLDRIDFITTDHHPRDFNNNIYHGYVKGAKLYNSTGAVVDDNVLDDDGQPQTKLTKVFAADTVFDGDRMTRAWTVDIRTDSAGHPSAIISCRANNDNNNDPAIDHRFLYAHFDGAKWSVHPLAKAGAELWPAEQDYTGLAALDPNNLSLVYVSTNVDPRDGKPLKVHEIFKAVTSDDGAAWNWTAVTSNSDGDNLRLVATAVDAKTTALLWFRGTMDRSQRYNSSIVGELISP